MISFIMMAKNVENYIPDAIDELKKEKKVEWELIIVDDHSTDKTFDLSKEYSENDNRIKVVKNIYKGKVLGTNYGYSLTRGEIIKCIDSDDVLLCKFFKYYKQLNQLNDYDAHCHSSFIVDKKLNKKAIYNVNPYILEENYEFVLSNIVSIPKWSWSFNRRLGDILFPMPETLPFEDVWISFLIKKNANKIYSIKEPVYLYRQHSGQTFGGIINYSKDIVIFRAKRLLRLINILENEQKVLGELNNEIFTSAKIYNSLLSKEKLKILDIINADLSYFSKFKIFIIRDFPILARYLSVIKWKLDGKN